MLLSMTGFGDARKQDERLSVTVEVRAVNNRYLKIATKCPDIYATLESKIEKLVRSSITRGTVSVAVRVDHIGIDDRYVLNRGVLENYWRQLNQLAETIHLAVPTDLGGLLELPGVVTEEELDVPDPKSDWPIISAALEEAIASLQDFRAADGRLMEQELRNNCEILSERLDQVASTVPRVVEAYRDRLYERVRELLEGLDAGVDATDLIREVSIFAERCDINEEITRLRSHLEQFGAFLRQEISPGRKLEFLGQEMFREVNTIGSKANDVSIAHCVVEMKAIVEKMREILQNVE